MKDLQDEACSTENVALAAERSASVDSFHARSDWLRNSGRGAGQLEFGYGEPVGDSARIADDLCYSRKRELHARIQRYGGRVVADFDHHRVGVVGNAQQFDAIRVCFQRYGGADRRLWEQHSSGEFNGQPERRIVFGFHREQLIRNRHKSVDFYAGNYDGKSEFHPHRHAEPEHQYDRTEPARWHIHRCFDDSGAGDLRCQSCAFDIKSGF